ncbi:MAG: AarF/ABC1/UbiB kinase family protein [Candidatus Melainabacteria bacterium]|nr:MAG: AarF/ABC1/UbiB kinase family protein [Candidatus Melainabacteria bacterium]
MSLRPEYLKRYKDIAMLFVKYGSSDLVKNAGLDEALGGDGRVPHEIKGKAEELTKDLEKLGPAFVKVGQMLSTRPDFLPAPYLEALARLQDNCEPFSFAEVEKIVTSELGVRISRAFKEFDDRPLAAASLGQIHHAVMRNGREVAVKVQRPGIRDQIIQDLEILSDVAEFYDNNTSAGRKYEYGKMLDEFRRTILEELDYKKEAHNLETMRDNLKEFERIYVPQAVSDYSTSRVLTMDFVKGKKITLVTPLEQIELDGEPLAEEVFRCYLKQILVDGFFHADPHPGNVFLTPDKKIGLIDLGMVARISADLQSKLLQLLFAISEGHGDDAAELAFEIGEIKRDFDARACRKEINDLVQHAFDSNIMDMEIGKVVLAITKTTADHGLKMPSELTMLGKTLLNLDQVGRTLDPEFDPNASVRRNAAHLTQQRMMKSISPAGLFNSMIETKDFTDKLPSRVNKILDLLASNKLHIEVEAIDEKVLTDSFQKIANRITSGLVLAALIIGAALLMRVETQFKVFGYPGLAMICFMLAAGGGFALVAHIMFYDQKPQKLRGGSNMLRPKSTAYHT